MSNIRDFVSSFKKDIARPSRFDVYLNLPPLIRGQFFDYDTESILYRCETAQLPARTLGTTEQKTYGPTEKFPYMTNFTDLDLTFIVDDDMGTKKFFDAWLEYINPLYSNDFQYKENYSADIRINQYSLDNKLTYSVNVLDAYPISVNQLDLDWGSDGYHKLNVTFAYTRWEQN